MLFSPRLYWWLAAVWTLIMLIGCTIPNQNVPELITTWHDKWLHILIFVPFGLLWVASGYRPRWVLVAGIAYGALIEIIQYLLPINRLAEWGDLLADVLGLLLGLALGRIWVRWLQRSRLAR